MNQRFLITLALWAAASAAWANGPSRPACTPQTTRGTWMYTCEGTLPAPTQTATRILGRCSASRAGFFSCLGTVNLGGLIIPQGLNGQATTLSNCTGTISYAQTLNNAPAGQLDITYVVSKDGDVISGLPTNSQGVLSCRLERIDHNPD